MPLALNEIELLVRWSLISNLVYSVYNLLLPEASCSKLCCFWAPFIEGLFCVPFPPDQNIIHPSFDNYTVYPLSLSPFSLISSRLRELEFRVAPHFYKSWNKYPNLFSLSPSCFDMYSACSHLTKQFSSYVTLLLEYPPKAESEQKQQLWNTKVQTSKLVILWVQHIPYNITNPPFQACSDVVAREFSPHPPGTFRQPSFSSMLPSQQLTKQCFQPALSFA